MGEQQCLHWRCNSCCLRSRIRRHGCRDAMVHGRACEVLLPRCDGGVWRYHRASTQQMGANSAVPVALVRGADQASQAFMELHAVHLALVSGGSAQKSLPSQVWDFRCPEGPDLQTPRLAPVHMAASFISKLAGSGGGAAATAAQRVQPKADELKDIPTEAAAAAEVTAMDRLLFAANVLIGYRVEVQVRQKVLIVMRVHAQRPFHALCSAQFGTCLALPRWLWGS